MLDKVLNILTKYRKTSSLVAVVLLLLFVILSRTPVIDSSLAGYNIDNNPYDSIGRRISSLFGTKNMIQVMVLPEPESARNLFYGLTECENEIESAFPGTRFWSLNNISILKRGTILGDRPVREILKKALAIPVVDNLVSRDTNSIMLTLYFDSVKSLDIDRFDSILGRKYTGIKALNPISQYHIQNDIEKAIIRDYLVIIPVIFLFIIGFLLYSYRNFSALLFCLINISFSFVPVVFFLSIFKVTINQITATAFPVVVILSISNSVHLINGYIYRSSELDKNLKIFQTLKHYFIPSFLSSLTTAIAFGSFFLSDSNYIRQFGILTACSILTVFVMTYLTAPLLIRIINYRQNDFTRIRLTTSLEKWMLNNKKGISLTFLTVLLVSIFFVSGITFQTNLETYIPRNSESYNNTMLLKESFHSLSEIDILIEADRNDTVSSSYNLKGRLISAVLELSNKIAIYPEAVSVESIKDQMDYEHQNIIFGISTVRFPRQGNPFVSQDKLKYRINIKLRNQEDIGTITRKFEDDFKKYETYLSYSLYGDFLYFDFISSSVTRSLLRSLLFSAVLIILILFILSGSIKATLISLLSNLVPLGFLIIIFSVFRIYLNITTSITLVICLGLIVDDTIHILYRRIRLSEPLGELGFGVLTTSLLLTGGFLSFVLSQSGPNQVFGLLCAVVFMIAAISDMTIMPWFLKEK